MDSKEIHCGTRNRGIQGPVRVGTGMGTVSWMVLGSVISNIRGGMVQEAIAVVGIGGCQGITAVVGTVQPLGVDQCTRAHRKEMVNRYDYRILVGLDVGRYTYGDI